MREMACSRALPAVIVLIALAAACSGGQTGVNPAGPTAMTWAGTTTASAVPAGAKGAAVPRDVTGTLNGRFDFTHTWGNEWWEIYSDSETTGTVSHLGLCRMYTRHIPTLTLALQQGTFRIVAANGDEIRGTYEGQGAYDAERDDLVHGVATFVITGGTGRFVEASGSFSVTLLETLDDPTWASAKAGWTLSGSVNY